MSEHAGREGRTGPESQDEVYAGRARAVAALVCAVQALALVGFAVLYVYELLAGEGDDATRVVMSALLMLVFAGGLAALAVHWRRGSEWAGTPTVVWNVLLLPVAWTLFQADRGVLAVLVGGVAVVGVVAALGGRPGPEGSEGSEDPGPEGSGPEGARPKGSAG